MKTPTSQLHSHLAFASKQISLLVMLTLFTTACSITGNQRSEKTSASITDVEKDIRLVLKNIDSTNNSLETLTQSEESDSKKSFKKYSAHVSKMEKSGKQLLDHTEKMRALGKEYFEEWRAEGNNYTNQKIQSLSEQRHANVSSAFAEISNSSVGVKGALKSYMTNIEEIQQYLSNDLTSAGIESIRRVAAKAISDGDKLKDAVIPVSQALANAKSALSQRE